MGGSTQLIWVALLGLLFKGATIVGQNEPKKSEGLSIKVKVDRKNVSLECGKDQMITWKKDGQNSDHKGPLLPLGSAMDDPRGFYECTDTTSSASLQVFFRMCQNCVHLNVVTILGIILTSVVATVFLAVAVYWLASEEPGWRSRASDKQNLLANEQLYQPLEERNNGQYNHIGVAKTRRR